jgi:hypothetical protein
MQTILVTDFLRARNLFITVVCIFFQTKKIRTHVSDERVATEPATTTAEESEASRAPGSRSHGRRSVVHVQKRTRSGIVLSISYGIILTWTLLCPMYDMIPSFDYFEAPTH